MRPLGHHLALTVYWLGNTLMWGALLHMGLQSRLGHWYPESRVGYYLGLIGFAGGVVGTAAQIISGAFSDRSLHRWGRRRPFVLVGSIGAVAGLLLLGGARSFWPFAGAMLLVQLWSNIALGPFTALLPDTVNPRQHGLSSGFMGVARLLGDVGGLLLAGWLLSETMAVSRAGPAASLHFSDQRMFLLCALLAAGVVIGSAYTCLGIRETKLLRRPQASVKDIILGSFALDVRANQDFCWLSVSRAVTNVGFYMFLGVLLYFLKFTLHSRNPEHDNMMVMLPAIGAAALASLPSGLLSDRIGRRPMVFAAQFIMAGAAALFACAHGMTLAYIAAIPAGLAYGVFTSVEWAFACNLLPAGESARYLGLWNASAVVPQLLAIPLAGALGSAISARYPGLGWRVDFAIAAFCCLLGAYFLRHVHERFAARAAG